MEVTHNSVPTDDRRIAPLSSTCFVAPKATGLVSLIVQFALLVISVLVVIFFFYHVGGYEYMAWNENSTILEPIYHHQNGFPVTTASPKLTTVKSTTLSNLNPVIDLLNDALPEPQELNIEENDTMEFLTDVNDTLIEQIPNTTIYLNFVDAELDMLELIRISTLVYLLIAILWLISIVMLLFSIKFEILDLVSMNAIVLTIAVLYAFIHALFIAVLLYYQRDISWRTMAIVVGSVVILVCITFLGGVCLALVVGWYKYIVYMNDSDKCYCIAGIVRCIKGQKRNQRQAAQEYAMPEVTRHNDIPYADEPVVHNFSSF